MEVLGSRRGGMITLAVAAVALIVAVVFAVWQLVERPTVSAVVPAPGTAVADADPAIAFDVPDGARLGDLRVLVDGRDATSRVSGSAGTLTVTAPAKLRDGAHTVDVSFRTSNVFARTVSRRWDFDVDTAAPSLAVAAPEKGGLVARRAVKFTGKAEPGTVVTVAYSGGTAGATADADGAWDAVAKLPEGRVATTITGADAAGNTVARRRVITVDTTAPDLALTSPAAGAQVTDTDQPLIYGTISSDSPRNLTFTARVNGKSVSTAKGSEATSPAELQASYGQASSTGTAALEVDGRRFAMAVGTLPQGRNRITVTVRDRAGNVARKSTVVAVNSTEEFGVADLAAGAKGEDIVSLQERLREAKVYPKKAKLTGVLDTTTATSVVRYQKRYHLPKSGVVDERTRSAMIGRIIVNLGQRKLRLVRNGRVGRPTASPWGSRCTRRRPATTRSTTSRLTRSGTRRTPRGPPSCRASPPVPATRSARAGSARRRRPSASTAPTPTRRSATRRATAA